MTENEPLRREEVLRMLWEEIGQGRRSGEEEGWFTLEEICREFGIAPLKDKESG